MAERRRLYTFTLPSVEVTPTTPASETAEEDMQVDDDMHDDQEPINSVQEPARIPAHEGDPYMFASAPFDSADDDMLEEERLAACEPPVDPLSRDGQEKLSPEAAALKIDVLRKFHEPPVTVPWDDVPGADWSAESERPPSGTVNCENGAKGAWNCPNPGTWGDYYISSKKAACPGCGQGRASHINEPDRMRWDIAAPKEKTTGEEQGKTKKGTGWLLFKKVTGLIGGITTAPSRSARPRPPTHHSNKSTHLFRALIAFGYPIPEALRIATNPFRMDGEASSKVMDIVAWLRKEGRWGKIDLGLGTKRFDIALLGQNSHSSSVSRMNSDELISRAFPDRHDRYEESNDDEFETRDSDYGDCTLEQLIRLAGLAFPSKRFDTYSYESERKLPSIESDHSDSSSPSPPPSSIRKKG
ncbi:hypothetical protein HBI56_161880 [Parastagonospora nodorum]|uniref:Uncharacterized protein n=1 Tax=Phaeosphaeria nodorum (strain SN15 / ATCC MYA-4574 / FGSC 10173) TaxID=321614 RepID=A0A7U2I9Y1_PHANO|nr:hypothetical protein HBH56_210760 [Parastagonospora nodorum]QRD05961.1 hypothetical protein JI435_133850 [Parastagonospora nodorum SN15]KAH3931660.1 hypothetical protein HBH54_099370 [Parastagonospora nodorum]KAH3962801.1 hypothetical protein HBH52_221780 [Parastagonospora nodorum]KAH3994360.1 hypothetical protein HBI10_186630 [Parastagonospora nodorum]